MLKLHVSNTVLRINKNSREYSRLFFNLTPFCTYDIIRLCKNACGEINEFTNI